MAITGLTEKEDTLFSIREARKDLLVDGDFNLRYARLYHMGF